MTKIKNDKVEKTSTNDLILEQLEKLNKEVEELKDNSKDKLYYQRKLEDTIYDISITINDVAAAVWAFTIVFIILFLLDHIGG